MPNNSISNITSTDNMSSWVSKINSAINAVNYIQSDYSFTSATSSRYGAVKLGDSIRVDSEGKIQVGANIPDKTGSYYFGIQAGSSPKWIPMDDDYHVGEDEMAPKEHASVDSTYGLGSRGLYGHVKLVDVYESALSLDVVKEENYQILDMFEYKDAKYILAINNLSTSVVSDGLFFATISKATDKNGKPFIKISSRLPITLSDCEQTTIDAYTIQTYNIDNQINSITPKSLIKRDLSSVDTKRKTVRVSIANDILFLIIDACLYKLDAKKISSTNPMVRLTTDATIKDFRPMDVYYFDEVYFITDRETNKLYRYTGDKITKVNETFFVGEGTSKTVLTKTVTVDGNTKNSFIKPSPNNMIYDNKNLYYVGKYTTNNIVNTNALVPRKIYSNLTDDGVNEINPTSCILDESSLIIAQAVKNGTKIEWKIISAIYLQQNEKYPNQYSITKDINRFIIYTEDDIHYMGYGNSLTSWKRKICGLESNNKNIDYAETAIVGNNLIKIGYGKGITSIIKYDYDHDVWRIVDNLSDTITDIISMDVTDCILATKEQTTTDLYSFLKLCNFNGNNADATSGLAVTPFYVTRAVDERMEQFSDLATDIQQDLNNKVAEMDSKYIKRKGDDVYGALVFDNRDSRYVLASDQTDNNVKWDNITVDTCVAALRSNKTSGILQIRGGRHTSDGASLTLVGNDFEKDDMKGSWHLYTGTISGTSNKTSHYNTLSANSSGLFGNYNNIVFSTTSTVSIDGHDSAYIHVTTKGADNSSSSTAPYSGVLNIQVGSSTDAQDGTVRINTQIPTTKEHLDAHSLKIAGKPSTNTSETNANDYVNLGHVFLIDSIYSTNLSDLHNHTTPTVNNDYINISNKKAYATVPIHTVAALYDYTSATNSLANENATALKNMTVEPSMHFIGILNLDNIPADSKVTTTKKMFGLTEKIDGTHTLEELVTAMKSSSYVNSTLKNGDTFLINTELEVDGKLYTSSWWTYKKNYTYNYTVGDKTSTYTDSGFIQLQNGLNKFYPTRLHSSITVGNTTIPVYVSSGEILACDEFVPKSGGNYTGPVYDIRISGNKEKINPEIGVKLLDATTSSPIAGISLITGSTGNIGLYDNYNKHWVFQKNVSTNNITIQTASATASGCTVTLNNSTKTLSTNGAISALSANITSTISAKNVNVTNDISAGGTITATSAKINGKIDAQNISATGTVSAGYLEASARVMSPHISATESAVIGVASGTNIRMKITSNTIEVHSTTGTDTKTPLFLESVKITSNIIEGEGDSPLILQDFVSLQGGTRSKVSYLSGTTIHINPTTASYFNINLTGNATIIFDELPTGYNLTGYTILLNIVNDTTRAVTWASTSGTQIFFSEGEPVDISGKTLLSATYIGGSYNNTTEKTTGNYWVISLVGNNLRKEIQYTTTITEKTITIPSYGNSKTINNVDTSKNIIISGEAINNTKDDGDDYKFFLTNALVLTATSPDGCDFQIRDDNKTLRIGPDGGHYTITIQPSATTVQIELGGGGGFTSISGNISYTEKIVTAS